MALSFPTASPSELTPEARKASFSLDKTLFGPTLQMHVLTLHSSTFSLKFYLGTLSLQKQNRFRALALLSLLMLSATATDCEILNSGMPSIIAENCCTTEGITCVDGRVTKMLVTSILSISLLRDVTGQLPLNLGQLTELTALEIRKSDLSSGPVPSSFPIKLRALVFFKCKLQGEFPIALRELKTLGIPC
jgi:hypothetical protein